MVYTILCTVHAEKPLVWCALLEYSGRSDYTLHCTRTILPSWIHHACAMHSIRKEKDAFVIEF